ncbi:MAG: hypothetical protein OXI96_04070 [Acidimicrobiaceae bacterium]|nr:hypothetical protein [Acidimicrobiaceae bacterium]
MNTQNLAQVASSVDPERLLTLLRGGAWETVGHRENTYERLRVRDDSGVRSSSIIVPLNQEASDFELLMEAALADIKSMTPDVWKRSIEPLLNITSADTFSFRKETSAPDGLIAWNDGSELINSARRTLLAGAKSYMEPSRYFSNRFGQFANRYLNHILMGQSRAGSYIVTALAPVEVRVPIRGTSKKDTPELGLDGVNVARVRDVTSCVVRSLEAATEAIDHFKVSGSMSGFDDQVDRGVSYELVTALRDITGGAEESGITVDLAPTDQTLSNESTTETRRFKFSGGDASVFERASHQLATNVEAERVLVQGRVHLLTKKEAGGPGVVGVDDGRYRYRIRLGSDEEYHDAVMAHDEDRDITVEGELSREGSIRWLYGARLHETLGSSDHNSPETLPSQNEIQSQLELSMEEPHPGPQ